MQWDPAFFFSNAASMWRVLNTARSSIEQIVWEPCKRYAVTCQEYSTNVEEHRSCHMQGFFSLAAIFGG